MLLSAAVVVADIMAVAAVVLVLIEPAHCLLHLEQHTQLLLVVLVQQEQVMHKVAMVVILYLVL
jgi:hypothetical protein